MKLVMVTWEDCSVADDATWVPVEGLKPAAPMIFHTVGWLQELTADHVVVTCTVGETLMGARTRIPAGMVRAIREADPASFKPVKMPRRKKVKV